MKPTLSKLALACALASSLSLAGCGKQSVDDHLVAADQYIQANNTSAAVLELKSAIQLNPSSAQARFKLGELYIQQKQFEGAEKELNRALELGYDSAKVLPLLSMAYQQTGAANALVEIDHANASLSASEQAKVGYYKLTAMVDLAQFEDAEFLIDELVSLDTKSVYRGLAQVYVPVIAEDYETATEEAELLRKQAPLNEDVLRLVSKLYLIQQMPEQAAEVMADLSQLRPDNVEMQFTYLALLMDLRRFEDAEPIVDKLLKRNNENGILNQFKGIILASQNAFEPSLMHLEKAILDGRDNAIVRTLAGFNAYRIENYADAVKHISMIADTLPGNHPGLRLLADSQLKLGQLDEASKTLSEFENADENDASLFSRAGFQLFQQGNVEAAREVVKQGSSIDAKAEELLRLGVLQLSLNDVEGIVKLEEAVAQAPQSGVTQKTLASAYLLSGELDKAAELSKQWKVQQPDAFEPYILDGELAMRAGNLEEAKRLYQEAQRKNPSAPEPRIAIVNVAIQKKNLDDAKTLMSSLLDDHPQNIAALALNYSLNSQLGSPNSAIDKVKQQLEANEALDMRLLLARMQFQEQDLTAVLDTLEPIEPKGNLPYLFWQMKGQSLLRTNSVQSAILHYQAWKQTAPFNKDATLGVLLTLDTQRKFEEALAVANSYASKRDDPQIDVLRAYFHSLLGNKKESRDLLSGLPSQADTIPFVHGIKARLALLDNRLNDALPNAESAYGAQPNIRNLVMFLRALEGTGRSEEGFSTLQAYLDKNPSDQRGKLLFAERLISRDKDAAIAAYEESIDAIPENFLALNNLAYLYYERGRLDDALPLAEKAVELRPSSAEAVDTLAQILIGKGDLKRARTLYDKVLLNPTRSDEVITNFIELLVEMGDTELAQRRLNERDWQTPDAKQKALLIISGS